jgi:glycosyltransferase involved in cell wall biosynthesis
MACETPVVSAPGGSLAEVLGSAALMVHAYEPEAWADALRHVLSDAALRVRLIGAGVQQAARYTWTETARRTWAVYQTVAS